MTRLVAVFIVAACCAPAVAGAESIVIGSGQFVDGGGAGSSAIQPGLHGQFFLQFGADRSTPWPELFTFTLTPEDVGRTFRATADTDPDFPAAVAFLTDGFNGLVSHGLRFADGVWHAVDYFESNLFGRDSTQGPDFAGFTITALTLRLDEFELRESPETREVWLIALLSVEGTREPASVPEPAALSLCAVGVAAVLARVRRRQAVQSETPSRRSITS